MLAGPDRRALWQERRRRRIRRPDGGAGSPRLHRDRSEDPQDCRHHFERRDGLQAVGRGRVERQFAGRGGESDASARSRSEYVTPPALNFAPAPFRAICRLHDPADTDDGPACSSRGSRPGRGPFRSPARDPVRRARAMRELTATSTCWLSSTTMHAARPSHLEGRLRISTRIQPPRPRSGSGLPEAREDGRHAGLRSRDGWRHGL